MPAQTHETIEASWRAELVRLIDQATVIGRDLRDTPETGEPDKDMLNRTLSVLAGLRQKTIDCHLPPPNGQTTLGLARGVTDRIDDLNIPLVSAVGAIERHYLTIPSEDQRFPALPDLTLVRIHADGSTTPPVPDGQAMITIQDRAILHVGIWRRGDFGGHKESPVNEAKLMSAVHDLVKADAPHFLEEDDSTSLICPAEVTEKMVWPEDQWPKE
jgi:hypothetical protein